jgi:transposase
LGHFAQHAFQAGLIKNYCTTAERRWITRLEPKDGLEAVQRRLDENPGAMRQ